MSLDSIAGRLKNARNQARSVLVATRHDGYESSSGAVYLLDEINAAREAIDEIPVYAIREAAAELEDQLADEGHVFAYSEPSIRIFVEWANEL